MTIKNFLECRGWSCDWSEVKSGGKKTITIHEASKNGLMRCAGSLTLLKIKCVKADKLNLKNKI